MAFKIGEIDPNRFRVTLFGSARIKKGDPRYKMVFSLAKMIGKEGIDIVTGGGPGLMNAANAGHEAGDKSKSALSFGLNIKLPKEQQANKHLEIKKEFDTFSDRLDNFMMLSDVVVVAPGGIGTLLELFYTWQLVQVEQMCDTPIILLGDHYSHLVKWMKKEVLGKKLMSAKDFNALFSVKNAKEAMGLIRMFHEDSLKDEHICKNFVRYQKRLQKSRKP